MKKIIPNIILILSICGLLFSGYKLWKIYKEYDTGKTIYENLEKNIDIKQEKNDDTFTLDVNFEELKKINPRCVGWIYIPNTAINYPIVEAENNNYELKHAFDGTYNINGSIFISEVNHAFDDKNTIIYGHNMKNGTMFSDLYNFKDQEFANNTPYIYLAKEDGKTEKYKVISAYTTQDCSDSYNTVFKNDETFLKEVNRMITNSEITIDGVAVSDNDKIITLSTCTSREQLERFVVHAIKVKD